MIKRSIPSLLAILLLSSGAFAAETPNPVTPGYQICSTGSGATICSFQPVDSTHPLPVTTGAAGIGLQSQYPISAAGVAAVPITAASGNVAAATATATLAAAAGKKTYLCGFSITSTGSTAAGVVSPSVTGTITGTLTFTYASVAGATLANQPLVIPFNPCVPSSAANTAIAVALPSLGTGNTNATVNAWGYQY